MTQQKDGPARAYELTAEQYDEMSRLWEEVPAPPWMPGEACLLWVPRSFTFKLGRFRSGRPNEVLWSALLSQPIPFGFTLAQVCDRDTCVADAHQLLVPVAHRRRKREVENVEARFLKRMLPEPPSPQEHWLMLPMPDVARRRRFVRLPGGDFRYPNPIPSTKLYPHRKKGYFYLRDNGVARTSLEVAFQYFYGVGSLKEGYTVHRSCSAPGCHQRGHISPIRLDSIPGRPKDVPDLPIWQETRASLSLDRAIERADAEFVRVYEPPRRGRPPKSEGPLLPSPEPKPDLDSDHKENLGLYNECVKAGLDPSNFLPAGWLESFIGSTPSAVVDPKFSYNDVYEQERAYKARKAEGLTSLVTRRADVLAHVTPKTVARFIAKVDIRSKDECWPWLGALNQRKLPLFRLTAKRLIPAHVLAYVIYKKRDPTLPLRHVVARNSVVLQSNGRKRYVTLNDPCCNPMHWQDQLDLQGEP